MTTRTVIVMDVGGYSATRFIDTAPAWAIPHLQRLVDGGIIRLALSDDRELLRSRDHVSMYGHSGAWGNGASILDLEPELYVMDNQFNLGHLELARKRMYEQDVEAKRYDLYERLDQVAR